MRLIPFALGFTAFIFSIQINAQNFEDQRKSYENLKREVIQKWVDHKVIQESEWDSYKERIRQKWNDSALPSKKIYVEYWDQEQSRIKVDYEKGLVVLESLSQASLTKEDLTKRIQLGLRQNFGLVENQVQLNKDSLNVDNSLPALSKQIESSIVRADKIKGTDGLTRNHYQVELPMVPDHIKRRAIQYLPFVTFWANKYSLPLSLILAIIWQESAFNPLARSHIPAFGLMQIVPKYAGEEVKTLLNESSIIDGNFLYNPENNIRYGISYLKILSDKSFLEIQPFEKRAPFIIAGYNWGPSRLLSNLKKGKIKLTTPRNIKEQIHEIAPQETKDYLIKVIDHWKQIDNEKWVTNS